MSGRRYPGLSRDRYGGMSPIGIMIRDAWVFGLLPEGEECAGWTYGRLQQLYDQVSQAWEPYGHLVSRLPEELRRRHERIHGEAIRRARALGWEPPLDEEEA